ncbi:MAG: zonular occludens toxin domain-containing protein [Nanoarchaeota archaeon]|nr:zonular occludens toxin domain-containing protein [Nanoarchaeota archaeon]
MNNQLTDLASLEEWFYEHEETFVVPYIEKHFGRASYQYQYDIMHKHLFFTKKIIEDDLMDNPTKQSKFLKSLAFGKSKIVLVEGSRGSGKTATAGWVMDQLHKNKWHDKIYFVKDGERPKGFPNWINIVSDIEFVPNGSFAVIDESAIKYSSRNSYKDENKDFTSRLVILRHKDITVFVITQHMKMVDINIRRLADVKVYKMGANLTHEDEDKEDERRMVRGRLNPRDKPECLVEISMTKEFYNFRHGLPDWFSDEVSKSFADYNPEEKTKLSRKERMDHARQMEREKFEMTKELEIAKIREQAKVGISPTQANNLTKKIKQQEGGSPADNL